MIKIYESNLEDKSYDYNGYTVIDNGNWTIDGTGKEFATDRDANEFIDSLINVTDIDNTNETELPKQCMTPNEIKNGYPDSEFFGYYICCNRDGNNYVGQYGFCTLSSEDLLLFKTYKNATMFIDNIRNGKIPIYKKYKNEHYYKPSKTKIENGTVLNIDN